MCSRGRAEFPPIPRPETSLLSFRLQYIYLFIPFREEFSRFREGKMLTSFAAWSNVKRKQSSSEPNISSDSIHISNVKNPIDTGFRQFTLPKQRLADG